MKRIPLLLMLAIASVSLTTGCIVNRAISASAVGENLAIEKAQNETLLLNVIRAKDRRPLYLTDIALITGTIKAEADLGGTVPFGSFGGDRGGGLAAHYTATPTLSYNWSPTVNLNVLNSQEFMRGFLSPLSTDTLAFFWNQGYPPVILLNLFVRQVTVTVETPKDEKTSRFEEYTLSNYPTESDGDYANLKLFNSFMGKLLEGNPQFVAAPPQNVGPPVADAPRVRDLLKAAASGFDVTAVDNSSRLQVQHAGGPILKLDGGAAEFETLRKVAEAGFRHEHEGPAEHHCKEQKGEAQGQIPELAQTGYFAASPAGQLLQTGCVDHAQAVTLSLSLRSPEAIVNYLGELARAEEKTHRAFNLCIQGIPQPLFVLWRHDRSQCGSGQVEVTTGGTTYLIPPAQSSDQQCGGSAAGPVDLPCAAGRSMQALAIASELIALQKSAKDIQAAGVVRVIGQ